MAAFAFLEQATLDVAAEPGQKAAVACKTQDGPEIFICTLKEGGQECCNLDLVFSCYTEFQVHGDAPVHLAGYYMPEYEAGWLSPSQSCQSADVSHEGKMQMQGCLTTATLPITFRKTCPGQSIDYAALQQ